MNTNIFEEIAIEDEDSSDDSLKSEGLTKEGPILKLKRNSIKFKEPLEE